MTDMATIGANGANGNSGEHPPLPRGRHNLPREQVRATQHERLLEGMVAALAEKGYARTTVADVIARAHTSRETFYEHFENKQACFLAAYDRAVDELTAAMRASFAGASPTVGAGGTGGRFEGALGAYLEAMASQPDLAHTFMIEVYSAGPEAWKRRAEVLERFGDVVYEVVRDEPALGALPDPRFAVRALVAAISQIVTGMIAAGEHAALPTLREPIMDLIGAISSD